MTNPYAKIARKATTASRVETATDYRLPGRDEQLVGQNGEINAGSKKDFIATVASLMAQSHTGVKFVTEAGAAELGTKAKRRAAITAAFSDRQAHQALGATIANELYITGNREGLMRALLAYQELKDGEIPMARMRLKNVLATLLTGTMQVKTQIARDNYLYPDEFTLGARPFVERIDIARSTTDVVEEKFLEAMEAFAVQEDRIFFNAARGTITTNPLTTVYGNLTPGALGRIKNQVDSFGIPAATCVFANDLWTDIAADAGFQNLLEPVAKHELVLTGKLGTILGMQMRSEAFRHPEHKVLNAGELFVFGAPEFLGQYTDRGGIETTPIDQGTDNVAGRGWAMNSLMSIILANHRAVAVANRQ